MKRLILIGFIGLLSLSAYAQTDNSRAEVRQKIQATRIAIITEKLGLTPEQAQDFWPLYNEFASRRQELVNEFSTAKRQAKANGASEDDLRKLNDLRLQLKGRELELEKEYSGRLLEVIDTRQLSELRDAEADVRNKVINYMKQREMRRQRMDYQRERQQRRDRRNDG